MLKKYNWQYLYSRMKEPAKTNLLRAFRSIVQQDSKEGFPADRCLEGCCRNARWFQARLNDMEFTIPSDRCFRLF